MQRKFKLPKISIDTKKAGLIVLAVVLFFLVMDLNTRLNELARLSEQQEKAETVMFALQSTVHSLDTQIAYAMSEGAVEEWAYEEGHMARPGEKLIIPLVPAGTTPIPVTIATPAPKEISNWQIWFALFSGK
jgi:cell division protein FtsB